jgi:tetratricopeptide (TPR) repeat protein
VSRPWRTTSRPGLGFALGFFALNPVAVYAVAYLIQRSIVMATFFVVCGLWLFARGLRERRPWMFAAAIACYAGAVFSKENAVLAPLAALPVYILVARPTRKRLALVIGISALLVAAGAAVLWRFLGQILGAPFDEFSRVYLSQLAALNPDAPRRALALSIENQMWLFFEYGVRWFLPFGEWMSMSMRPPFPVSWLTFPQVLGRRGLRRRHRGRVVDARALARLARAGRFLLARPGASLRHEFMTVWVQDPFVLYRSYLWAIGVPASCCCSCTARRRARCCGGHRRRPAARLAGHERVLSLATPESAWGDAIASFSKDPRAVGRWFPYLNRGSYYADRDQFELAIRDFETSAALGDMGMGSFNAGSLLARRASRSRRSRCSTRPRKQGYNLYSLPFQRGVAYAGAGNARRGLSATVTSRCDCSRPRPRGHAAAARATALQVGRPDGCHPALAYLESQPRHAEARYLLAMAHVGKAEHAKALDALEKRLRTGGPSHYARALAYHGLGRKADAQREIDAAIRIGP